MARYISSVAITFAPKPRFSLDPMVSLVVLTDVVTGSTVLHAIDYVHKVPLVKRYFKNYVVVNLTFKYSEL